jgi:hypothetical protein
LQDSTEPESRLLLGLLGGGSHFDDMMRGRRAANHSSQEEREGDKVIKLPCAMMVNHVSKQDIHRPAMN